MRAAGFQVELRANIQTLSGARESQPAVAISCGIDGQIFATPGVRLAQLTGAFGANGLYFDMCAGIEPAMRGIAARIGAIIGP